MKSAEQALLEWVSDEIAFDGGSKHTIYTREEFERLVKAIHAIDPGMLVKIEGPTPLITGQSQHIHGMTVTETHYGRSANWCVDWTLALNFYTRLDEISCRGKGLLTAQRLARFSSFMDANTNFRNLKV